MDTYVVVYEVDPTRIAGAKMLEAYLERRLPAGSPVHLYSVETADEFSDRIASNVTEQFNIK
jgi:hypothetical protein